MLVLTRKKSESIVIDDNIEVTIIDIGDGKIKLGISAPKNISILRKEVYLEIKEENKKAANIGFDIKNIKKYVKNSNGK